ncbi:BrnT family toxin [Geminocystis sp. CENA526]|uniref:BrnT family toxin n=1 Tax=Geminocystis sp. CENA526 TaxID=1355871 RepID=UPI003D6E28FE
MQNLDYEFEWDEQKNIKNQEKHGIRFEDAIEVFDNDMVTEIDNRYDYGEIRLKGIGKIIAVYFTIIYTERGEKIRIISARKSNKKERLKYDNYYS